MQRSFQQELFPYFRKFLNVLQKFYVFALQHDALYVFSRLFYDVSSYFSVRSISSFIFQETLQPFLFKGFFVYKFLENNEERVKLNNFLRKAVHLVKYNKKRKIFEHRV